MANITKLSRREYERLIGQGKTIDPAVQVARESANPLPPLPVVDTDMVAAHAAIEAAKETAQAASEVSVRQAQLVESLMTQMRDQMKDDTGRPVDWRKIKVRFTRDRNQLLREAEFERVE